MIYAILTLVTMSILISLQLKAFLKDTQKLNEMKQKYQTCKFYSFKAASQPNFLTVELCDGKLESLVITKETRFCVKRIIHMSPEITAKELGIC